MTLLAVGSVAFDDLETPSGARQDVLGGSATYFSLSASRFSPVRIVAVVGEDFGPAQEAVFRGRPIDLEGLVKAPGASFRWKGRYNADLNTALTLDTQLNVFADFHPHLPERYRSTPCLFLGNIDPVLQLDVVRQMSQRPRWIALDTMNFWINGSREALEKVLREVDILLVNEAEVRALTGEYNLLKACRAVQAMGPRLLVIKRGEYGALLLSPEDIFALPAFPLEEVVDPTGAGDTFAGGFLGHLAAAGSEDAESVRRAAVAGAVMASFTVESFGTGNLENVSDAAITERMKAFSNLIRVTGL